MHTCLELRRLSYCYPHSEWPRGLAADTTLTGRLLMQDGHSQRARMTAVASAAVAMLALGGILVAAKVCSKGRVRVRKGV